MERKRQTDKDLIQTELEYLKHLQGRDKMNYRIIYDNFVNISLLITPIWLAVIMVLFQLMLNPENKLYLPAFVGSIIITLTWVVIFLVQRNIAVRGEEKILGRYHLRENRITEIYNQLGVNVEKYKIEEKITIQN